MVVSLLVTLPSSIISLNTNRVPQTIMEAERMMLRRMSLLSIACFTSLGGFFISSLSAGSTPRLWAGGPSMMMLIQRICIGFKGLAVPMSVDTEMRERAAMLVLSWNRKKFRMFTKIDFPSSIADRIVEKSSS